jgi:hypothetical protein
MKIDAAASIIVKNQPTLVSFIGPPLTTKHMCGRWNNRVWLRHTAGSFLRDAALSTMYNNKVSNSRQDARGCCFWTNRRPLPATRSNARFYAAAQWVRAAPSMAYARIHQPHKGHWVSECAAPAISVVWKCSLPAWQYNNDAPIMTLFDTTSIRFYIQCHLFNSAITLPLLWLPPRRALNFATRRAPVLN